MLKLHILSSMSILYASFFFLDYLMLILCEFARTEIPPHLLCKLVPSQFTPAVRVSEFQEHLNSISFFLVNVHAMMECKV